MVNSNKKFKEDEINRAGSVIIDSKSLEGERETAMNILDEWRAAHSYPMHIFQMRLKKMAERIDDKALTAQRLKRVPAIIFKLKRVYAGNNSHIQLYDMQDISGCRAILSNVELAKELYNKYYLKGEIKHKLIKVNDYISNPKKDGYRSIHLIYSYKSDKNKKEFNGLLTEIQIRSKLQHLWATAIETVDLFTKQAIKSSEGRPEWAEFFRLVSSAFAKMESCPSVPHTPTEEKKLYSHIKQKEIELNIIKKMIGWTNAMKFLQEESAKNSKKKYDFFLLELDIESKKLSLISYPKKYAKTAIDDYNALERKHSGRTDYDVVLVGADKSADLKKAYPNYFGDTTEFIANLQKILAKA